MPRYFDTHAHLNDPRIAAEYPGGVDGAVAASREAGVCAILNAGTNLQTSRETVELTQKYERMYAAVGIHPSDLEQITDTDGELAEIIKLCENEKVRAIGEIGLDYYWDKGENKTRQMKYFDAQLSLAEQLKLPVIVHDREAHGDALDIVRAHKNVTGVFHSFSGSSEMARELVKLGWYISFTGVATYKNASHVRENAASVPSERLMLETDCPYLTPVPHRGKLNIPAYVVYTAAAIAQARGVTAEELACTTWDNAVRFFGIGI